VVFYDRKAKRYLRFLMQAKVLDDKDRLYSHIDRLIGNTGVRQIDRLKKTAENRGVPALYAFYNHLNDKARLLLNACSCYGCGECWGVSVATLPAVLHTLPDKSFDALRKVSYPWLCLLCARTTSQAPQDLIARTLIGLRRLDTRARETLGDLFVDVPEPRREAENVAPDYLPEIIEMDLDLPATERETRLTRMGTENPGVDGVVLIDADRERPVR
jgi:hypothetical protein